MAEAALTAARQRLARIDADAARIAGQIEALAREPDPALRVEQAETARDSAMAALAGAREARTGLTARRETLTELRDTAAQTLAATPRRSDRRRTRSRCAEP